MSYTTITSDEIPPKYIVEAAALLTSDNLVKVMRRLEDKAIFALYTGFSHYQKESPEARKVILAELKRRGISIKKTKSVVVNRSEYLQ